MNYLYQERKQKKPLLLAVMWLMLFPRTWHYLSKEFKTRAD